MPPFAAQIRCSYFQVFQGAGMEEGRLQYNFPLFNTQALRFATKISSPLSGLFQRDIVE